MVHIYFFFLSIICNLVVYQYNFKKFFLNEESVSIFVEIWYTTKLSSWTLEICFIQVLLSLLTEFLQWEMHKRSTPCLIRSTDMRVSKSVYPIQHPFLLALAVLFNTTFHSPCRGPRPVFSDFTNLGSHSAL